MSSIRDVFWQIHRGTIVNINAIARCSASSAAQLE